MEVISVVIVGSFPSVRSFDRRGMMLMHSVVINSIGSTVGCPKTASVVFVGVAADCTYVQSRSSFLLPSFLT